MMYGADADELERIAKELDGYEAELGQLLLEGIGAVSLVGLSATLGSVWRGPRSNEFAGIWQSRHLLRLRDSQEILRLASQDLRSNAGEQRTASSARTSVAPGGGITDQATTDEIESLDYLEELADAIGLGDDALDGLFMFLRAADPDAAIAFGRFFTDHLGVFEFAEGLSFVGDALGALTTFAQDFVQQYSEGLPLDEVVVHATSEMMLHVGVDVGAKKFGTWAGAAILGAVTGGVGAPVGAAVGWFAGTLTSYAATAALNAVDGFEAIADLHLKQYQMMKAGVEFVVDAAGNVIEIAGEAVEVVMEGGELVINVVGDLAGSAIEGVVDVGENLIDGAGNLLDGAGNVIGGIFS